MRSWRSPIRCNVSLVELMDQLLEDDYERTIFREEMNGSNEQTIAELLRRTSGVPWSKYMVSEGWRRFRKRARRRIGALVKRTSHSRKEKPLVCDAPVFALAVLLTNPPLNSILEFSPSASICDICGREVW